MTTHTQRQGRARRPNRAQKREANRERILRAAREVFGKRGFHAATIEEIAAEAGLSNGAIYYNFKSKGDLFFELMEERQEERLEHLRGTLGAGSEAGAPGAALIEEARDATRSLRDSREWRLLLFEFVAHAARTPSLAARLRTHKHKFRTELAAVLEERLAGAGTTPAIAPERLGLATVALANGLAFEEVADPGCVPDGLLGDVLELMLGPDPR